MQRWDCSNAVIRDNGMWVVYTDALAYAAERVKAEREQILRELSSVCDIPSFMQAIRNIRSRGEAAPKVQTMTVTQPEIEFCSECGTPLGVKPAPKRIEPLGEDANWAEVIAGINTITAAVNRLTEGRG